MIADASDDVPQQRSGTKPYLSAKMGDIHEHRSLYTSEPSNMLLVYLFCTNPDVDTFIASRCGSLLRLARIIPFS